MTTFGLPSPVVSVLMSCYNGARWLGDAIESVLIQTHDDLEFIIVNDGSMDDSAAILETYARQDPRILVISKVNTGLADSLNVGILRARGEWIARLDADDICAPTRLEKQLANARRNSNVVFVGSGMLEVDENGHARKTHLYPERHETLVTHLYSCRKFPPHSSAFYRTDAVRSLGGYRLRMQRAQDRDLWLRLSEVGQFTAISEALVSVRKHSSQISQGESGRRQHVYSRVSITSYWLRHYGCPDPVAADDAVFEFFWAWVRDKLDRDRLSDFLNYMARVRATAAGMHRSPSALFAAARYIMSEPRFLLRWLRYRIFGDMAPRMIALEWMRKHSETYDAKRVAP